MCDVWGGQEPGWRQSVSSNSAANGSSMLPLRLGLAEVMNGHTSRGCVDATGRLGPFGHSAGRQHHQARPWTTLRWGSLQSVCAQAKIQASVRHSFARPRLQRVIAGLHERLNDSSFDDQITGRTAVVVRTWDKYTYSSNQVAWLRAMTTELALDTSGRYQVFLLVDIHDDSVDLRDEDAYAKALRQSVPEAFQDMAMLFNKDLLENGIQRLTSTTRKTRCTRPSRSSAIYFPNSTSYGSWRWTPGSQEMLPACLMTLHPGLVNNLAAICESAIPDGISALWDSYDSFSAAVDHDFAGKNTIGGRRPGTMYTSRREARKRQLERTKHGALVSRRISLPSRQ